MPATMQQSNRQHHHVTTSACYQHNVSTHSSTPPLLARWQGITKHLQRHHQHLQRHNHNRLYKSDQVGKVKGKLSEWPPDHTHN
jgi:hypothetical protein